MTSSRIWTSLGLLVLVQACGSPFNIQENCDTGFYTTDAGKRMQWPDGHRIDFEMHKSVPKPRRDVIVASGERYNRVFSSTRLKIIGSELSTPDFNGDLGKVSGDNVNAIYWVSEKDWIWGKSDPQAVAMTVVSFSHSGIREADIFFRAKIFSNTPRVPESPLTLSQNKTASDPLALLLKLTPSSIFRIASAAYDMAATNINISEHQTYMVSVHELGHALGRCHSDNTESIMYPEVSAGTEERRAQPLSEIDLDILSQAYTL
jgi:hypothetical protein